MRLSLQAQQIIHTTVAEFFGQEATVLLFGSRVDDRAKGGDIDLIIRLPKALPHHAKRALQLVARLQCQLGDQPIDVLVVDPDTEITAIHQQALIEGIKL